MTQPPDDDHAARTLAEHLPPGYTADLEAAIPDADAPPPTAAAGNDNNDNDHDNDNDNTAAAAATPSSSLLLQGGDVHRSLYRMVDGPAAAGVPRRATFHEGTDESRPAADMLAVQGFRRDFLLRQQRRRTRAIRQRQAAMQRRQSALHLHRTQSFGAARLPVTRNFVEFLELYGHFADEDLDDGDDDEEAVEEEDDDDQNDNDDDERRPLLDRPPSAGAPSGTPPPPGNATTPQAFFTLFKAFVGTGIMFLPKAYNNGGMAFSTATLLAVAVLSMTGFRLLLACRQHAGVAGYGDIGLAIAGPGLRRLILGAIALSQLGFVCAGLVFCAENLASAARAMAERTVISVNTLILLEVLVLVPLAFIRDIARLGPAALLGDVFIGLGLVYMYSYDVAVVAGRGWHMDATVAPWINPAGAALTVGAAIFTFEGIGLILPIQSSMAAPDRFGRLLAVVMALITALYVSVGALCYAAFGTATRTEIIDNYPRGSRFVQAVQSLYALAVLAGLPVQLFPAVRIVEGGVVGARRCGKRSARVKWAKNGLRAALVGGCGVVAAVGGAGGGGRLDRMVALIGSVACVPLLFVFPPYLHLRAGVARTAGARLADVALMAVGGVAMVFTTVVTLM